jgi:hypothetical protein
VDERGGQPRQGLDPRDGIGGGGRLHVHRVAQSLHKTGNLKTVQKATRPLSIQTTGDIYTDWDIDQLTASLSEVLLEDGD